MAEEGISACVVNLCTIKPLDEELVLQVAQKCGKVITCEEHNIIGGLGGGCVRSAEREVPHPRAPDRRHDEFGHSGPAAALLKQFGLSAEHIVEVAKDFCK